MQFPALFGDTYKTVKVTAPLGGSDGYNILIDNYFHGNLFFRNGTWVAYLNASSELQGDDIGVLVEMMEAFKAEIDPQ